MNDLINCALELVRKGDEYLSHNGPKDFHLMAQESLIHSDIETLYNLKELVKSSFEDEFEKQQNYHSFEFSDLPLTLARGEHCFVDLYFWRRRPTVIHNHHFSGAFICLDGSNVDYEYTFDPTQTLGKFHTLGKLNLISKKRIGPGDVVGIDMLDKFIHQNHHHADLTVNVCFRTPDRKGESISNFLSTGLKYSKEASLLHRVERLIRFYSLADFEASELKLNVDDALNFLIQTHYMDSGNRKLLRAREFFRDIVKQKTGIDIDTHLRQHEAQLTMIEEDYD